MSAHGAEASLAQRVFAALSDREFHSGESLAAAGGEIAGVFLNRIEVNPPGFIQALSP